MWAKQNTLSTWLQNQELHIEAASDAQTDEAYTLSREVARHRCHPLSQNLYQYERRVLP